MAISTYAELQTAIDSWRHRSTAQVVDFITLAEKRINSALSSRLGEVESTLTGTIGSRYIALPSGYISPRGLWLTTYGNRIEIIYVTPENLPVIDTTNGQPYFYTIDGSNISFDYPNSEAFTYTFRYKKGYNIASTSTNDILTNYPGVYLYASLRESALFDNDDNSVQKWESVFQIALQEAQNSEFENRTLATLSFDAALSGDRQHNIISGDI